MADIFDKNTRSYIMSRIRAKNTKIETIFRESLRKRGIKGYKNNYKILGKPDIIFMKEKIVIFIDGDFWHGYLWKVLGKIPPKRYWQGKIAKNIERDKKYNKIYKKEGWTVLRFWEHNILSNADKCVEKVADVLKMSKRRKTDLS